MVEEEIPQRIAFVSDKIFEPSPWRRWLAAFWNSGARLGFASAAMLSASLVLFALRPAPAPVIGVMRPAVSAPAVVAVTQASAISEDQVQQRIQAAVEKAVDLKTKGLMKEIQNERVSLMVALDELDHVQRKVKQLVAANYTLPEPYREEVK
jgi:hypothetical protein